jgi:membrane complex biogenesis BtpA family protein
LIGMVHLAPLPGAPRYSGDWQGVLRRALADAAALCAGGVDAVMVENFGDAPFLPGAVAVETVAHLTVAAHALRAAIDRPMGINVLRNDAEAALAIAAAVGAEFVRVNVLTGARVTDQGIIEGKAHAVQRLRQRLCPHVRLLADVDVKHSAALAPRPIAAETRDTLLRGLADAVIVSGEGTGHATDLAKLAEVRQAAAGAPVLVGSGATLQTLAGLLAVADGVIVGTATKRDGDVRLPVDPERVRALVEVARQGQR